ncbi:hypothetical protein GCM10010844_25250 [Deinococcus radiotolerans]|uniref:Uncharacterized protein n=1 Tax=Deinococcus radiotolerans TaxID=1309407 RepID=A0ABQ2FLE8_9DEIO|nr:hypothetical protein GCM10010844_25250 [Deinococcus radiotolerans]
MPDQMAAAMPTPDRVRPVRAVITVPRAIRVKVVTRPMTIPAKTPLQERRWDRRSAFRVMLTILERSQNGSRFPEACPKRP